MNDSQETRLPSSPENSEVEDNESPQDASQLSSIAGTPREQWDRPSSMINGRYAPPSQIHLQQRRHSDYEPLSRLRDVASSQSHLQQRRHVAEQTQQYGQEEATPQSHLQQRRHVAAQQENYQQQSLLHDTEQRHPLANITNAATTQSTHDSPQQCIIPEWDGCTQDAIIKRLKQLDEEQLQSLSIREFYKSYGSWEKMTLDQRNKTVSYFRSLQGLSFFHIYLLCLYYSC